MLLGGKTNSGGVLTEKSRQENLKRLQQLEAAKKKLGAKHPSVFDINNEIQQINRKLSSSLSPQSSVSNNVSAEESNDYLDQQDTGVHGEPFGQDLNGLQMQQEDSEKRRVAKEILQNEPAQQPEGVGPQAQASAKPRVDASQEELKPTNKIPGGPARKLARRGPGVDKAVTAAGGQAEGAGETVKQGAKQLSKAAKKAASQAVKKLAARLALANPVTLVIIGVGLMLVTLAFVIGISYIGRVSTTRPSASGGTALVPVNLKTDAGALQNFMKLTGDKTVSDKVSNETNSAMRKKLLDFKESETAKNDPVLTKQIDAALGALDILSATKATESAQAFLKELGEVYNLMEGSVPVWAASESTRLPINGAVTSFNDDRHGNSFLRPEAVGGHNVYLGSNDGQTKCDAVDIGVTAGDAIYPVFGGKVLDVSSDGDESGGKKVVVTSNDGKYTVLYAHLKSVTKAKNDAILIIEPLGVAKTNNVQIEVFYTDPTSQENNCLVINHADMIDHASTARRHQNWGGYLWDRIVKTFNLK